MGTGTIEQRNAETAIRLMRMALALLDRAGPQAGTAACRLQHAIDTALADVQMPNRISSGTPTMNASAACDPSDASQ